MIVGARVRHPALGSGTVVAEDSRRRARVNFGYAAAVWLPVEELEFLEDVRHAPPDGPEPQVPTGSGFPALPKGVIEARRAILALKLGQVLEENVCDLSVGTESIQTSLERAVAAAVRRQPRGVLIEGSWGSGKTHLLTLLTALAARAELVTARVILDGEGVTLTEPMGLMEAILGSLRYPGEVAPCGIGPRLGRLRRQDKHSGTECRIAETVLQIPDKALDEPEVLDALEEYFTLKLAATPARSKLGRLGWRGISLPPMKARSVADRAERFCELLRGWAEFCASTGAKGLAVVFDEVDVEYATPWNREWRRRRSQFLEALDGLLGQKCPLLLAFGSAPPSGNVEEENDAVGDLMQRIDGMDPPITAPRPTLDQTLELANRLQMLYAGAYPDRMPRVNQNNVRQLIEEFAARHQDSLDPTPRSFVRGTLERLDVASSLNSFSEGS